VPEIISLDTMLVVWAGALAWMWRYPQQRTARVFMLAALTVSIILTMPIVPHAASLAIGHQYGHVEQDTPSAPLQAIVLLGAGTQIVEAGGDRLALLDSVGAARVLEAARAYRALQRPWVISSGGTRRHPRECSSAHVMADALVALGVDRTRILLEDESLTTRDEAVLIAPMLSRLNVQRFVLVTTRSHMPRSLRAFRQAGLDPVPSVAADELGRAPWHDLLTPDVTGLRLSHALLHEMLGLAYYQWRGWLA
jgi:uncharacterized SAM-binding protein YcdF (DUF218 family)